jgi:hypothetical protein
MTSRYRHRIRTLALLLCTLLAPTAALADECGIDGTVTATQPNDPGFEGLWKYCVDVTWDTSIGGGGGLSHASVFLGLETCECVCNSGVIVFPSPAGTSNGDPDPCVENYNGEYACMGDPAIPDGMNSPAVKFEHDEIDGCEPGSTGTGTFCFYSIFPPAPANSYPSGLGLKSGGGECVGELTGQMPTCQCAVPVQPTTWGRVKAFRS